MSEKLYEENYKIHPQFTYNWKYCFTKFNIFNLVEYDKIVFLDCDILVLKNIDNLFECPHMTAAVDGEYFDIWPEYLHFNAGCLVIEPSNELYKNLIKCANEICHDIYKRNEVIADQEVLNFYFKDWADQENLHLNKYYNIFAPYIQESQVQDILDKGYFIHFIGRKPWAYFIKNNNETYSEYFYNIATNIINFVLKNNINQNKIINKVILSVYAICKNEKENIEKWLKCFSKADYVCVLDTGSTDGTWELLQESKKQYSNLIIDQQIISPWRFDTARNLSLELVPKETNMYFMVDLDEMIKDEGWAQKVKNAWSPNFDRGVYNYNRNVDENDNILRTIQEFRIHSKKWHKYVNVVHEALVNELGEKMFLLDSCTSIPIEVWHYPKQNKETNYLELCEYDLELYPNDAIMRLQLAIECEIRNDFEKARKHYRHLLEFDLNKIQWFESARCYTGLGYTYYKEGDIDRALYYFREGRIMFPQFSDNYLLPIEIFFDNKNYKKVIEIGELALQNCLPANWCNITDITAFNIFYFLGISHYNEKNYIKALGYLSIASQLNNSEGIKTFYKEIINEYLNKFQHL